MIDKLSDNELNALISLLDDSDEEVARHVEEKLTALGLPGIPRLEDAWENTPEPIVQEKLEDLIQKIQFSNLKQLFQKWLYNGCENLMHGALLVSRVQYPDLDESRIYTKIEKIVQSIWIELNSGLTALEEANVINNVLYNLNGFIGDGENPYDPENGFISHVIESKKGNSLTLGILYLYIANELNLPIYGVNLPYHFVTAYCRTDLDSEQLSENSSSDMVLFYMNPLNNGMPFSRTEINHYLERSNIPTREHFFSPTNNLTIIQTLVLNQITCFEQKGQTDKARKLKELYDLFPERRPAEED